MNARASFQTVILAAVLGFVAGRMSDGVHLPDALPNIVAPLSPATKATAATYVYEERSGSVPSPVLSALNKLNRERHILATALDADVKDGTGDEPEQYKVTLAAARKAGLPALVITSGDKVLAVVANPKTEAAVLEAVK